ncbi:RNA-binding component of cleavage and polyadenylation factor [Ascosphaera pollenicola]|nr:RNA-binding component of cleavage and polyadenylation factor [Ascosphaera pollenicola]
MSAATTTRPKVLMLGTANVAKQAEKQLSEVADLVPLTAKTREEFLQDARSGKFDGCVAAYKTFWSTGITGLIDQEVVEAMPKEFRFISIHGAGYDYIDVNACAARQPPIYVSNTPGAVDDATADCNMFLILGALRNFNASMVSLREGSWRGLPAPSLGHDPQGKTLGILGMGGIGRNLKRKAEAFGMKVIYHNRRKLSDELADNAEYVSFDELLARSDVLSLNLPLNANTRHIIGPKEFEKMKDGIVIVNTARGAVMDEDALVKALDSGKVWNVGLDVFEEEPKIHPGLLKNPKVLLVPHMGTWCVESQEKMESLALSNVRSAVLEKKLLTPVPEHKDLVYS